MTDYFQPDFYRFNEDSLRLVEFIYKNQVKPQSIVDLGAGCGVIGIELAYKLEAPRLTLVEAQNTFLPYLEKNVRNKLKAFTSVDIVIKQFSQWNSHQKYDLVVCNPPYYLAGHGEPSKDVKRHMARSFVLDSWEILLNSIKHSLSSKGKAFLVVKADRRILEEIEKAESNLQIKIHELRDILILELVRLDVN